ncbi:MAG: hypothetical protein ABR510_03895 [Trueperaceae bacterium]
MSERPAQRPSGGGGAAAGGTGGGGVVVRAGCGRTRGVSAAEVARAGAGTAFAYLALEFPECPTCPHRVDPEGADSFCAWRPVDAPHPFAALAGWDAAT